MLPRKCTFLLDLFRNNKLQKFDVKALKSHYREEQQKHLSRAILKKRCSENMQQIYRRTLMPKSNFNKVGRQLY